MEMDGDRGSGMEKTAYVLAILSVSFHILLLKQKTTISVVSLTYLPAFCPGALQSRSKGTPSLCDCRQNSSLGVITFEIHPPFAT